MKKIIKAKGFLIGETVEKDKAVLVEDGLISDIISIDEIEKEYGSLKVEDFGDLVLVPGTVNAHNHCFQSLLRGIAADRPFLEWRDKTLYAYSPKMRLQDIYTGALFAFTEMMKCGATTVSDFFYLHQFGTESDEAIVQAARDAGIRLVIARTMYDWDGAPEGYRETVTDAYENTKKMMEKYTGGMAKVIPAPHSLHAASPDMVRTGHRLALEFDSPMHIHVAEEPFEVKQVVKEHGTTPLRYLDELGVVDSHMAIIHGVWLDGEEIELLGKRKGSLIYCPSSNMFLADGITDIPKYLSSGVNIALGSDGACGNNRISVFEEMRMVAILQKAKALDALSVNFHDAYKMGMANAAKALDLPVGKIEKGYTADFVAINCKDFSMQPLSRKGNQFLPNLIYSLQPTAIAAVIVNGETTVKDGKLTRVSDESVLKQVAETMEYLEEG